MAMYPTNRFMVDPSVFSNKPDGVMLVVPAMQHPTKA
jgi:hypothetical protein